MAYSTNNNDDEPSFVATSSTTAAAAAAAAADESDVPSHCFYDTSNSTEEEDDDDDGDCFLIQETKRTMNIGSSSSSSSSSSFQWSNQDHQNPLPIIVPPEQKPLPSLKQSHNSVSWCWCRRPPFPVTAMYLWTQFNVSYLLRKLSFLFDTHQHSNSNNHHYHSVEVTQQHHSDTHYFHLMTIHYFESGVVDIIVMNLIVILFLSTSYIYRSSSRRLSLLIPTITNTTCHPRSRLYRNKSYLLEFVTVATFLLLTLQLRGAAINVLLVCIIFMFIHLIRRFYLSAPSPTASPSKMLLLLYKL